MIGDAGTANTDATYAGESGGLMSLDYFRAKSRELQDALLALDEAYQVGLWTWHATGEKDAALDTLLREYETKALPMKATAEALNLGAQIINASGGRAPVISIPANLGLGPAAIAIPAAAIAALAAVAIYSSWAPDYSAAMRAAVGVVAQQEGLDPAVRDEIIGKLEALEKKNSTGVFAKLQTLAGGAKWLVFAGLAFFAYRLIKPALKGD